MLNGNTSHEQHIQFLEIENNNLRHELSYLRNSHEALDASYKQLTQHMIDALIAMLERGRVRIKDNGLH